MIRLSPRVLLYRSTETAPSVQPGEIALAEIPSSAFGDGSHPTTRLCSGIVDLTCRLKQPAQVLDVGTGTGVLARIARARGAKRIVATDIDPVALEAARKNIALDHHPVEIEISDQAPDSWESSFDLVIANILEAPLRELAPRIAKALKPGGTLALSGFTRLQVPALRLAYERHGIRLGDESALEEWVSLFGQRAN